MPRVFDRAEIDGPETTARPDATGGAAVPAMAAAVSSLLVSLLVVSASASALGSGAANLDNVFGVLAAAGAPGADPAADDPAGQQVAAGDVAPGDPGAPAPGLDDAVPGDAGADGDPGNVLDGDGDGDPADPAPGEGPAAPGEPPAPGPGPAPAPGPGGPATPAVTPAPAPAVRLYDDDQGAALFSLPAMAPGRSYERCITVTYEGATPARVALVTEARGALAEQLGVRIEVGRSGSYADCTDFAPEGTLFTGTLASLADLHGPDGAGLAALRVTSTPTSRSFRITFALICDPGDVTANADFQWRATAD